MSEPSPPAVPPSRAPRLLAGMIVGNLAAALQFAGVIVVGRELWKFSQYTVYGSPSLIFVAMTAGFVASVIWRRLSLTMGQSALHSLTATLIAMGGAAIVFREGAVCILMAAPIYYFLFAAGAETGRRWFRRDSMLRLTVLPLLFLAAGAEFYTRGSHSAVVVYELRIAASPDKVWPHVQAFEGIAEPTRFWLFRLGLPYPVSTTNAGTFVGADRSCEFSGGAVFREKVVELVPSQRLTFDIVESPPHPELMGHLDARRGQFFLRDNGDGTTTLVGSTWYSLHVRPAWYFDLWTQHIFSAVHLRVMRHVKLHAENGT